MVTTGVHYVLKKKPSKSVKREADSSQSCKILTPLFQLGIFVSSPLHLHDNLVTIKLENHAVPLK